ncbi:hypothetical protein CROQUDRAFT_665338 [Cronartium quercuum f. sp. fusiforme G11]|uniref:Glutamine amidotransferase domain-containing protein n=1 Tax=Cronartium quercuum f. sp. fusiforme G11 TaxID=708437 RepID=A0A9P6N6D0_9BASI|nr:hypothetical protein CROQUDRAFT_665338 [Cronartium quercuum f. sp. fusiforme G11]
MQESFVNLSGVTDHPPSTASFSHLPTLIILLAGSPVSTVLAEYGTYHQIFCQLFHNALSSRSLPPSQVNGVRVISFDVVSEEYPSENQLNSAIGLLITGSASSVYDELPWISRLIEFCEKLPELYSRLKLFGICFGHQIFARALGSTVSKSPRGWEIGVRTISLTEIGKKMMDIHDRGSICLHQLHQDHVLSVPNNCFSIGSTSNCDIHGLIRFGSHLGPSEFNRPTDISLLTVQGHPEFNPDVLLKLIDAREEGGVFSKALAEESRKYARMHDDGVWFGTLILQIMGI